MRHRLPILAARFAALVILGVAPSLKAETIDQSYDLHSTLETVNGDLYRAQTFTVGLTGQLTRMEAWLSGNGTSEFEIWNTVGGVPEAIPGTALASGIISFNGEGFFGVDISAANLNVTAGDVLALVQIGDSSTGAGVWNGQATGTYVGGATYTTLTSSPTGSWSDLLSDSDLAFRTYVTIPEPATLSLVIGCFSVVLVLLRRRTQFRT